MPRPGSTTIRAPHLVGLTPVRWAEAGIWMGIWIATATTATQRAWYLGMTGNLPCFTLSPVPRGCRADPRTRTQASGDRRRSWFRDLPASDNEFFTLVLRSGGLKGSKVPWLPSRGSLCGEESKGPRKADIDHIVDPIGYWPTVMDPCFQNAERTRRRIDLPT